MSARRCTSVSLPYMVVIKTGPKQSYIPLSVSAQLSLSADFSLSPGKEAEHDVEYKEHF